MSKFYFLVGLVVVCGGFQPVGVEAGITVNVKCTPGSTGDEFCRWIFGNPSNTCGSTNTATDYCVTTNNHMAGVGDRGGVPHAGLENNKIYAMCSSNDSAVVKVNDASLCNSNDTDVCVCHSSD
jgi:hypothetical protein